MEVEAGRGLICDLLADPRRFNDDGRAYDLLQAYFEGLAVETLRPLLRSADPLVRRVAVFVASELGGQAADVIHDVIPLLESGDRYLQYHAMEVLTVCCGGEHAGEFAHVARQLESADDVLRALAMRLVARADVSQFEAARRLVARDANSRTHQEGLQILAAGEGVEPGPVAAMIGNADPLLRRYGAIAAKRLLARLPSLMSEVGASDDGDLRRFYHEAANALPE
ncbi:MAG: hypothetical protein HYV07_08400 [Deltaproteobacteria bacterium]|nr:hypothetical protein [Deltaproteobacteria bacterium]